MKKNIFILTAILLSISLFGCLEGIVHKESAQEYTIESYIGLLNTSTKDFLDSNPLAVTHTKDNKVHCLLNTLYCISGKKYMTQTDLLFDNNNIEGLTIKIYFEDKERNSFLSSCDNIMNMYDWESNIALRTGPDPQDEIIFDSYEDFVEWMNENMEGIYKRNNSVFEYYIALREITTAGIKTKVKYNDGLSVYISYHYKKTTEDNKAPERHDCLRISLHHSVGLP